MSEHPVDSSRGKVDGLSSHPSDVGSAQQAECERLKDQVRQLEADHDRDKQTIATLQAERDVYLRSLYAWAREQVTEEDWREFAPEDYSISSGEVLELLEQLKNDEHA
jgi:hypothetical protein